MSTEKKFGKWNNRGPLSRGAQGLTCIVTSDNDPTNTEYVLKQLTTHGQKAKERFQREIAALTQINHPNVLRIIDSNILSEPAYYVSEYHKGGTLDKLPLATMTILEKLNIYKGICLGLEHIHTVSEEGPIVHRDLKPGNIFLSDDRRPIIGDFGICYIAKEEDDDDRLTTLREQVGPRYFRAPEYEDGLADDVASISDIYSMGKLLYWMVSNGRIFEREKHRDDKFNLIAKIREPWVSHIYEILDKTIKIKPQERYQTARELLLAVDSAEKGIRHMGRLVGVPGELCLYCTIGTYRLVLDGVRAATNPEYQQGTYSYVRGTWPLEIRRPLTILECDYCGNIQMFNLNRQDIMDKWKRDPSTPER